jgi:hypothetical protein
MPRLRLRKRALEMLRYFVRPLGNGIAIYQTRLLFPSCGIEERCFQQKRDEAERLEPKRPAYGLQGSVDLPLRTAHGSELEPWLDPLGFALRDLLKQMPGGRHIAAAGRAVRFRFKGAAVDGFGRGSSLGHRAVLPHPLLDANAGDAAWLEQFGGK